MSETPATAGRRWPDLILVNGPSSAGKTTLCRALQAKTPAPYLVAGFDDFIFMAAPRYYRGAGTARQDEHDAFTALGVEMTTRSPPGGAGRRLRKIRPGVPRADRRDGTGCARLGRRRQCRHLRSRAA